MIVNLGDKYKQALLTARNLFHGPKNTGLKIGIFDFF